MEKRPHNNFVETIAVKLTSWVGSTSSIIFHSIVFVAFFILGLLGVSWDMLLLVLTTLVSLEAIYLSIFIQMTVNRHTASLQEVETDIDEIREDVEEITEDVGDIQEDVEELSEDVEEITEDDRKDDARDEVHALVLEDIQRTLRKLMDDIERLKNG
ncbi:MAG TPA: DUF1003 domain-containing protein [Candidatus Paceibacterota bacterium]|nr:DUF1003 domain-containing protein [Candidatus Paceibacterota bacterium]